MYSSADHTFVVCAYGESPYLSDCIESVLSQTVKTNVIIATSTPCHHIDSIAERFGVKVFINSDSSGIANDWNFALESATTSLVTLAHQDDIYHPRYAECALACINDCDRPLIYFTNYSELRDGVEVSNNLLLRIKRALLCLLKDGKNRSRKPVRIRSLSLGSPICCPSVTMETNNLEKPIFISGFKSNLDWQAWLRAAKLDGDFFYDSRILVSHRIHGGSETSHLIGGNIRTVEDLRMLEEFWPRPMAKLINLLYSLAQKSNF